MNVEEITDNMRHDGHPGLWWSIYDGSNIIRLNSREVDGSTIWKVYTTSMEDVSDSVDIEGLVRQVYGGSR